MAEEPKNQKENQAFQKPVEKERDLAKDATPKPRVFIAGLSQTGRELIARLKTRAHIVAVDIDPRKLEMTKEKISDGGVELFAGDATSRLVWKDFGLHEHDTVVALTRSDEANLEVCKIVGENFGVKKLVGLIHSTRRADEYLNAGIETVSRASVLASFIESHVFKDLRRASDIGLGKGEIVEVPILPGSPVVGRPLKAFRARPWLVGAIYRNDALIVPHGNTVIRVGDKVLLIGEPHIISSVADFFRIGDPEFPLQFGSKIGVLPENIEDVHSDSVFAEASYLAENSRASSTALLRLPGQPEPNLDRVKEQCKKIDPVCEPAFLLDDQHKNWPLILQSQGFGCIVTQCRKFGFFRRVGVIDSFLLKVLQGAEYPVLISKGSFPYDKILVPITRKSNPLQVSQLAVDLARLFKSRLDAVTVTEPVFSVGKEAVEEQKMVLERVEEYSDLYRFPIKVHSREGNPIREIVEMAKDYNLLVLGYSRPRKNKFFHFDLGLEIMARVACSVLILPFGEDAQ